MLRDGVDRGAFTSVRAALTAAAVAMVVLVASAPPRVFAYNLSSDAVRRFDHFLDDHPWVARDLQRDPSLATDRDYLEEHRSLREFLDDHPDVDRALREDPYAVLRREHHLEREQRQGREIGREEMERFDRFLRDHPGVAHDLRGDPSLVNSRGYLGDHPGFRDFLHDHPAIRQELQDNPYAFMRHWERWRAEHGEHRGGHRPPHARQ